MVIISSYQIKLVEIYVFCPTHLLELRGQDFMPKHLWPIFFLIKQINILKEHSSWNIKKQHPTKVLNQHYWSNFNASLPKRVPKIPGQTWKVSHEETGHEILSYTLFTCLLATTEFFLLQRCLSFSICLKHCAQALIQSRFGNYNF